MAQAHRVRDQGEEKVKADVNPARGVEGQERMSAKGLEMAKAADRTGIKAVEGGSVKATTRKVKVDDKTNCYAIWMSISIKVVNHSMIIPLNEV
jgi:hypothetical protein